MFDKATKHAQLVDRDWEHLGDPIDGVIVREVRHVNRDHGVITELYRSEWDPTGLPVDQSYQSRLYPGAIGDDALVINFPSLPYQYEDPDHYRLPIDTDEIPYTRNKPGSFGGRADGDS